MTPLEYFRLLAPEFSSVYDATVEVWLTVAGNIVVVDCLDDERAAMATALYAAHMLCLSIRSAQSGGGAVGQITSEKEGDLQRTYASIKNSENYIGQTSYGIQYDDLTKVCSGVAIMTRGWL